MRSIYNERVGWSVCMQVYLRNHVQPNFINFFVHVNWGRGLVLFWRCCDILYTSGFADDIVFLHNGFYNCALCVSLSGDKTAQEPLTTTVVISHVPHHREPCNKYHGLGQLGYWPAQFCCQWTTNMEQITCSISFSRTYVMLVQASAESSPVPEPIWCWLQWCRVPPSGAIVTVL